MSDNTDFDAMVRQWECARAWVPGRDSHPYATQKQLSSTVLRQCRLLNDWLYVPMMTFDGTLMSWQRLSPQPEIKGDQRKCPRFFARGVSTKGGLLEWGPESFHILLAESISSADACYQLRHRACGVVCAFSALQMPTIAALIREKYPESEIVLCGDNDTADKMGVEKAWAEVEGCRISYPPEGMEWSDVLIKGGWS